MKHEAAPLAAILALALSGSACTLEPAPDRRDTSGTVPPVPATVNYAGSPYLGELRNTLLYGDIWERPQLSPRDRSLVTIAALQALDRAEVEIHIGRGLDNGLTPEEISEIILHVTFYAGWPTGVQASGAAARVLAARGLSIDVAEVTRVRPSTIEHQRRTSGGYAAVPRLGELRDVLLYGEIWERPQLSKRDRSLITVSVAQALYASSELRTHIGRALDNGATPQEISEVILHITFYAGWPTAVNAGGLAAEVFEERGIELAELE